MKKKYYCVAIRGRNPNKTLGIKFVQRLEINMGRVSNCLTTVSKDCMVLEITIE